MHVQVWTSFPRALCIWQLIVRCLLCSEIHAVFDFLGDDFVNMSSCSALLARQWIYTTRQSPVLNFTHFFTRRSSHFWPWALFLRVPRPPAVTCPVPGSPAEYVLDLLGDGFREILRIQSVAWFHSGYVHCVSLRRL